MERHETTLQVQAAIAVLERDAGRDQSPDRTLLLAEGLLASGNVDRSIGLLEALVLARPTVRHTLALGAGYYRRAVARSSAFDLVRALDTTGKGLMIDPADPGLRFNEALILTRLGLSGVAKRSWERYADSDAHSYWRRHAQQAVASLSAEPQYARWVRDRSRLQRASETGDTSELSDLVRRSPQSSREYVEDELLPAWADDCARIDRCGSTLRIRVARQVATALLARTGDRMCLDQVASVEASIAAGPDRARRQASAYRTFREARGLMESNQESEAAAKFESARAMLTPLNNPLQLWAAVHAIHASFNRYSSAEFSSALEELQRLDRAANRANYASVRGRILYMKGSLLGARAELTEALAANNLSYALFQRTGEGEYAAASDVLRAHESWLLGDPDASWRSEIAAVGRVPEIVSGRRRYAVLIDASIQAIDGHLYHAALRLLDETLAVAQETGLPRRVAESRLHHARALARIGGDVREDLRLAEEALNDISDESLRESKRADLAIAKGEAMSAGQARDAIRWLGVGLDYFVHKGAPTRIAETLLSRGRVSARLGLDDAAEDDFERGIETYESYRRKLSKEEQRLSSLDRGWDLFESMVELQLLGRRNPARALAFVERSRARTLLESVSGGDASLASPSELRKALPPAAAMVYYAVLHGHLATWVLTRDAEAFVDREVDTARLEQQVEAYVHALESAMPRAALDRMSEALYEQLIGPVSGLIAARTSLVIVPDAFLHGVPFATLRDRRTGRYLVEDHASVVVPSANIFASTVTSLRRRSGSGPLTAYVVGDPRVPANGAGDYADLRDADIEAAQVAALYQTHRLARGALASRRRFVEDAGGFDVVHFAGHAQAVMDAPLLSRLELAPDADGEQGTLFADQLRLVHFARTRLVVLAACRTAIGQTRRGEGVLSLARPVLAAGVPSVVATLWDVQDRSSRNVLVRFHQSIQQMIDPWLALRQAQLEALRSQDAAQSSPSGWGAFVVLGGLQ